MRLTTGRERSRRYQREANDLLEEQLYAIQNLAQPQAPSDTRPRGTCPECHEMMLRGASTCPYCHTTGITWSTETRQEPVAKEDACFKCGGKVTLEGSRLYCLQCNESFRKHEYPHFFKSERKPVETKGGKKPCERCGGIVILFSSGELKCSDCLLRSITKRNQQPIETKETRSNNTRETGSVAKVFGFTIKWCLLPVGAFWITTNFPQIMAIAALGLTLVVAGGNNPEGPRGWVAWCLGAMLNGLWCVFTLFYQSSSSFFGDSPPWTRFLNFPALVVVESIILMVVLGVLNSSGSES